MTQIILPNTNITGANLWSQVEDNDQAIADVVNGDIGADNIQTGLLPPTGSILQYAGGSAPTGWLLCQGQEVSRTGIYQPLFAIVSTAYGVGDGSTTFNLPDLQGRIPVGQGSHESVNARGKNEGTGEASRRPGHNHTGTALTATHTHSGSTNTAGSHSHGIYSTNLTSGFISYAALTSGVSNTFESFGNRPVHNIMESGGSHDHTISLSGGGHTHSVQVGPSGSTTDAPSFVVVNYIIKV